MARRAYRAARLFTGDTVLANGALVVCEGRIEWVGAGDPPEPVRIVDLGDATLLPGLIDAHSHLSIDPSAGDQIGQMRRPAEQQLAAARRHAPLDLASGVTTMRVMGEEAGVDFLIRDEIAAGAVAGPDLVCAGVQIAREGHHGHALTGVRDEADIEALARRNIANGAGLLKIFATGGISSSGTGQERPPFTTEQIERAASVAHEHGLKLAAHAHGGPGAYHAIRGGVDTIEHGAALDEWAIDAIVSSGLAVVGTFSILYHARGIQQGDAGNPAIQAKVVHARRTMEQSWRAIVASGARVAVGTDSMHGLLPYDLEKLVEFGATPFEALRAATVAGAEVCGLTDRGRLAPGLRADILAVSGNPLLDITHIAHPVLVVANGRTVVPHADFPDA